MVLNVSFTNIVGKTIQAQLQDNFSIKDFRTLVAEKIDRAAIEHYRFVANNKDLCLEDEAEFLKRKHLIKNGVTIFLLRRMHGGGHVETSVLIDIIIEELPIEIAKLQMTVNECVVCLDDKPCLTLCCNTICAVCFPSYFKSNDLQLTCMVCRRETPYTKFFVSTDFIHSLESLTKIRELMKNIDCQICHCGALVVNETMFAQQTCQQCQRTFCFFCNKDWNNGLEKRRNDRYTCHVNCDYETKLNFDLIPYVQNKSILIPNSRCCPKCFNVGGYDGKCKYHQCVICKHTFCFLCLAPKIECDKSNDSIKRQCAEVRRQDFTIFPRIANS
jgi:hypothetical protein